MAPKSGKKQAVKNNSSNLGRWMLTVLALIAVWYVAIGMFGFTLLLFDGIWANGVWFYVASFLYIIVLMWLLPFWVVYKMAPKYKKIMGICAAIATSWWPLYIILSEIYLA